jgi:hypothetical protein
VEADPEASLEERLEALTSSLTKKIFEIVSPGLYERERHILALLLWLAQLRAKVSGGVKLNLLLFNTNCVLGSI